MNLPGDSIGITDLIAYRECPRRFSYGMKRHVGLAQQDQAATMPEATLRGAAWARFYGSAFHDLVQLTEDGKSDPEAMTEVFKRYGHALNPDDVTALGADLDVYRTRDMPGTRIVGLEDEYRVPLMVHDGRQIYFRFKLDRLYERLDAPGTYIHTDYKTSRHRKGTAEVHSDVQMWAYNWGIHTYFAECEQLLQIYDQLRFGQEFTRKTQAQRDEIHEWLVKQATAVLEDDEVRDDGLMAPRFNEWCAYCPIMESCPVIPELSDWALTTIAALQPVKPKIKKDGSEGKQLQVAALDPDRIEDYADQMEKTSKALTILRRFDESVRKLIRDLPEQRRSELRFELRARTNTTFSLGAMKTLHEGLGDRFYEVVTVGKGRLEENLAEDESALSWALGLAEEEQGTPAVFRAA